MSPCPVIAEAHLLQCLDAQVSLTTMTVQMVNKASELRYGRFRQTLLFLLVVVFDDPQQLIWQWGIVGLVLPLCC